MKCLRFVVTVCLAVPFLFGCTALTGKTAGQNIDDETIAAQINGKIIQDPQLSFLKIDVDSFRGNVTLSGQVPSKEAEERLITMAQQVKGVKSVNSNLQIGTGQ